MAPFLLLFLVTSLTSTSTSAQFLGLNYGTLGNNLPTPNRAIQLIQSINGCGIRIYDLNSTIIQAASIANIPIAVTVPNDEITFNANDQSFVDRWITTSILPFGQHISYIFVGNEILSDLNGTSSTWPALVPAMKNIYQALQAKNLKNIVVSTTFAMDCITTIDPPSEARFRPEIPDSIISPLLKFLKDTNSYYFVNAFPYSVWSKNHTTITLDYALFIETIKKNYYVDRGTKLKYKNLLDQMLDSVIYAMRKIGYKHIKLGLSETGWPHDGDYSQIGASVYNAAMYNRNLVHKLATHKGTPLKPKLAMPVFLFALFDENLKPGFKTERNFGLFFPNETAVYPVDLTGKKPIGSYPPIPLPTNNVPYQGKIWCVLTSEASKLPDAFFNYEQQVLCNYENNYCGAMADLECFLSVLNPHDQTLFVNFDMNFLWQQDRNNGMPCYFDGYAAETIHDPSINTCIFPAN